MLGVVQGLTEFLPVSSSGHLVLMRDFLEVGAVPVLFDVVLHVATLIVVVLYFRDRVWGLLRTFGRWVARKHDDSDRENLRLIPLIVLASALTAAVGFAISALGPEVRENTKLVSALFLVTAAILVGSRFYGGSTGYDAIGPRHAIVAGLAQGIGVFPGISRSGITISAAQFSGIEREKAGEFSFVLSVPAIIGALILSLRDAGELSASVSIGALIAGSVAAFGVGLLALKLLMGLVRGGRLHLFSFYLIPLGVVGLVYL